LSASKVSDLLLAGEVGIVVLDVAAMHDAPQIFVTQIKRQFPDLVVVVAGSRESETALAGLISAGVVYRFIHKPMSPGRARLFAEAAVRKYGEQRLQLAIPESHTPSRKHFRWGAAALLTVTLVGGSIWALRTGSRHELLSPSAAESGKAQAALSARAASALADNRLTAPAGDNALELYLRASAQNPADPNARAGLTEVRDRLLARAENALLEERTDEAATAIEAARRAGVERGRIAFLSAQLAKIKDQVKAAQAARRRAAAGKLSATPEADERAASLVALADARIQEDHLIEPPNDNAKYYLLTLRGLAPNQPGLAPALQELGSRLVAKSRLALTLKQYAAARSWLAEAASIGFTSAEANSVRQELGAEGADPKP
jgi:hypothetical protein